MRILYNVKRSRDMNSPEQHATTAENAGCLAAFETDLHVDYPSQSTYKEHCRCGRWRQIAKLQSKNDLS